MAKKDKDFDNDELVKYYTRAYEALEKETNDDTYGSYVLNRVKGGQKTVFNKTQSEIRNFDMSFLDTIESVYPAITKIMRDPKKSLRYEQEIVAVEKARKTNSDTVRHLSSHTHLIKEIKENGDVIPSKVLTTFAEEELAIYENRFLKSLVRRMEMFLERRYEVMKISLESFETERLNIQNEFLMSGQTVSVSLDIAIKNDLTTNVETTKEQYNRLLYIREMVQALKGTDFMRALAKARDVLPPIMKTNILMHNPDFKLCYGLWLYLDRVDGIATNIDVKEKSYKYSAAFDKDINNVMTLALTAFIKNRNIDGIYSSKKLQSVKAPKPIENETLQLEMNLEAGTEKTEDYTMNQIMLDQTAQFFEGSMQGLQQTGTTYNESVKVVFKQMLDMVDQLYPRAFGISDDEFESADLYKQLEYARRQMMVAKIVKQQKQMSLAKMGREEKRIEKLILKLEEKIKKQEARERERLEKEAARIEAQRQAALERERAKEAKRKALEKLAVEKAKEIERRLVERKKLEEQASIQKLQEQARIMPHVEGKRKRLKELREKEKGKWDNPMGEAPVTPEVKDDAPAAIPVRRKDDFDGLSDDELAELLAQNDLLDSIPEKKAPAKAEEPNVEESKPEVKEEPKAEEKPKKPAAVAKKPATKPAPPKPAAKPEVKEEAKSVEEKKPEPKVEDPIDDFDAFLNSIPEKDEAQAKAEEPVEEAPVEEATPTVDDMDDFDAFLNSIPEKEEAPSKPAPKDDFADIVNTKPKNSSTSDDDDDFDNMSDEELEALMAANDMDF